MSVWNSFKKKVNDTWSGADFWDQEENRKQREAAARVNQPQVQTTPVDNGGSTLRVSTAQPTQRINIDTPSYANTQVTVDAPPINPIDAGLNAGKSWEQIARETGADQTDIANYSRATRPNYGVAQIEKPKQSNWNKFRDVLDANTEADKWRRQEANKKRSADEQVPVIAENPGNIVSNTVGAIPRMFNTAGNQIVEVGFTAQQQFATQEYSAAVKDYSLAVKSGNQAWIDAARKRTDDAAQRVSDIEANIKATKEGYSNHGGLFNAGTLYNEDDSYKGDLKTGVRKVGLGTAEGMLDVYSLGLTSVTGKQIAKVGVKQAIKDTSGAIVKNAIVNTTQGGVSAARQGAPLPQVIESAALSGTAGTAGDLLLAGTGAGIIKSKNGIVSMLDKTPTVKVNMPEVSVPKPTMKVTPEAKTPEVPSVYQAVNPKTGEKIYKVIDPQDFEAAKKAIDGGEGGIAGTPRSDGFVPHITAKTPAQMEALGFTNAGKYTTGVDDVLNPTPKIEVGKTQSLADLLPNIGDRKAILPQAISKVDDLKAKYNGLKPEVIDRLVRDYGEEKTANILARTSDATGIRDMNGFVISEAKKAYGAPTVRIQGSTMSPEELASLEASAPPLKIEAPIETLTVRVAPEPAKVVPPVETPPSKLGRMADEFYQSRQGNQRIKFTDLKRLGEDISKQVDADFKAIGTTFQDVARKVQEGSRNGAKTLQEAGLTPDEARILRNAQEEMNYVRRRASVGRREVGGGDVGEMYIPQQKVGQNGGENLFEGFRATKPGNENVRKNRIELEDLDYSPDVIGEYVTRYGDTKLYREERLARALAKNNPTADEETLAKATQKLINIQDKVNEIKTKIGAFGFGLRQQTDEAGKFVDSSKEFTQLGKDLGHNIETILDEPKGLTNGDRINSIAIDGQPLGDRLGLNQYRDAQTFASKQVFDAGNDRQALADMVSKHLQKNYNLHPDDIDYAVGGISRIAPSVPDEVVLAKVTSTYRNAAKQQLLEELQHVDIQNVKLRKDVSSLTNQILREGSIESELSNKVVGKILQTQNMIFRKLNVSSALNELSDLTSFTSVYGKGVAIKPDFNTIKEFGLGEIDAAIEPYIRAIGEGKGLKEVLSSINDKTNLYKFVEHYKAGVVATSAKNKYIKQGLTGDALAKKVLEDYRTLALPVDAFTKTFLDNAPLYTQYMTWGLRNIQKEGKLATGKISLGVLEDMSTKQRIARNAYANLPAKTVFWLASNGLKGTGILTAFGLTDFTGLTNQDYSGIAEEDKSWFDKTTQFTNSSTTLSMLNSIIQSVEKEQLKNSNKYKNADYNPYDNNDPVKDVLNKYTPSFIKNVTGTNDMLSKGYSENKDGRVQYEAPTDFYNIAKSYLFGKAQTDNAREYGGRQPIWGRDGNPITNIKDMAAEQIGLKEGNYTRPLTEEYSKAYKAADEGAKTALLKGGREYNKYLDDLKKNQPEAYDAYISALDGNHVSPEYWREITKGSGDLTAFNALKGRNKQKAKDLGIAYDPIYDLPDNQAKSVLQQKSTATGDDIALRNALYKEKWYTDYMDKVKAYYEQKAVQDGGKEQTQRVVDWYNLNDQYNGFKSLTTKDGKKPDWATTYPLTYQSKAINDKYGFDSDESKAFYKVNGDAYKAEKAQYDQANLDLINKMRAIEGYPAMTAEQYAQVTSIKNTDKKDNSYGSKNNGVRIQTGDYGNARGLDLPSVKIQVAKQNTVKKYAPKNVKIKRTKAKM